jgi:phage terminase large subunit-like protein
VETNQGGDLWRDVFAGIPGVRVRTVNSTESKDVRFATALEHWQRHRVWHSTRHATLEEQAVGFPRHAYDDVVDAAVIGVQHHLGKGRVIATAPVSESYLEASA